MVGYRTHKPETALNNYSRNMQTITTQSIDKVNSVDGIRYDTLNSLNNLKMITGDVHDTNRIEETKNQDLDEVVYLDLSSPTRKSRDKSISHNEEIKVSNYKISEQLNRIKSIRDKEHKDWDLIHMAAYLGNVSVVSHI